MLHTTDNAPRLRMHMKRQKNRNKLANLRFKSLCLSLCWRLDLGDFFDLDPVIRLGACSAQIAMR